MGSLYCLPVLSRDCFKLIRVQAASFATFRPMEPRPAGPGVLYTEPVDNFDALSERGYKAGPSVLTADSVLLRIIHVFHERYHSYREAASHVLQP